MSELYRATLIGSISIFLWGTLALLTRLTDGQIPAFQMMAMTFAIAFLLMCTRWWKQGHSGLRHLRQPLLSWILGVGGFFGYHWCYFMAMTLAPAVEVSLLAYLWPLLMVLFSALLPGHRLSIRHLLGAFTALAGCWMLISNGGSGFDAEYLSGYLLALTCALIWSTYSVASRLVSNVATDAVGWFCAVTAMLAWICHLHWETTLWPLTAIQWAGIAGLGLGPVGIAFFTWDYGVKHGNLQLLGVLAFGAPIISAVLLVLAGEAEPGWTLAVACLAVTGGSVLASISFKRRSARRDSSTCQTG